MNNCFLLFWVRLCELVIVRVFEELISFSLVIAGPNSRFVIAGLTGNLVKIESLDGKSHITS